MKKSNMKHLRFCCCTGLYSSTPCPCYFQEGQTALYKASYYGQRAVVDTLVNAKACVDVGNKVRQFECDVVPHSES